MHIRETWDYGNPIVWTLHVTGELAKLAAFMDYVKEKADNVSSPHTWHWNIRCVSMTEGELVLRMTFGQNVHDEYDEHEDEEHGE